jgi:hypothetical protein
MTLERIIERDAGPGQDGDGIVAPKFANIRSVGLSNALDPDRIARAIGAQVGAGRQGLAACHAGTCVVQVTAPLSTSMARMPWGQ